MMDDTADSTTPREPFGLLPEPEVPRDDTYAPVSETDREAYEADVAHVLHHDRDGDGDVDLLDAALSRLSKVKDLFGAGDAAQDDAHSDAASVTNHDDLPAA